MTKSFIGVLIIFAPIPMGLRLNELSYLALIGITWLLFSKHISLSGWKLPLLFLVITIVGALSSVHRGSELSYFQFFRGIVFSILLIFLLTTKISEKFMKSFESLIPYLTAGVFMSAFLFFFLDSDVYNSSLDIAYDETRHKRLFIYPIYLFLLLFINAVINSRKSQIIYGLLLVASGSKAIFLSILLSYLFVMLGRTSPRQFLKNFSILIIISLIAFYAGLQDRITDFIVEGDPWRIYEPLAAIENLLDPFRFFIGNGSGIPYWDIRVSLSSETDESLRVIQNTRFDVHNGILAMALKFGVPLMLIFVWLIFKSCQCIQGGRLIFIVLILNIFLSHGPVQVVEAIGLAFGLRLLMYRAIKKNNLQI